MGGRLGAAELCGSCLQRGSHCDTEEATETRGQQDQREEGSEAQFAGAGMCECEGAKLSAPGGRGSPEAAGRRSHGLLGWVSAPLTKTVAEMGQWIWRGEVMSGLGRSSFGGVAEPRPGWGGSKRGGGGR